MSTQTPKPKSSVSIYARPPQKCVFSRNSLPAEVTDAFTKQCDVVRNGVHTSLNDAFGWDDTNELTMQGLTGIPRIRAFEEIQTWMRGASDWEYVTQAMCGNADVFSSIPNDVYDKRMTTRAMGRPPPPPTYKLGDGTLKLDLYIWKENKPAWYNETYSDLLAVIDFERSQNDPIFNVLDVDLKMEKIYHVRRPTPEAKKTADEERLLALKDACMAYGRAVCIDLGGNMEYNPDPALVAARLDRVKKQHTELWDGVRTSLGQMDARVFENKDYPRNIRMYRNAFKDQFCLPSYTLYTAMYKLTETDGNVFLSAEFKGFIRSETVLCPRYASIVYGRDPDGQAVPKPCFYLNPYMGIYRTRVNGFSMMVMGCGVPLPSDQEYADAEAAYLRTYGVHEINYDTDPMKFFDPPT
jgi:hypothetical protein